MVQIANYGKTAHALISEGQRTSRGKIPLGTYFEDGIRKYVWAKVTGSNQKVGMPMKKNAGIDSCVSCPGSLFTVSATAKGFGNAAGNTYIQVAGLSTRMTAALTSQFMDGYLYIVSSVGRGPGVYALDYVEAGKEGSGATSWSLIHLKEGIAGPLSTGSRGFFRPNPFYGCRGFGGPNLQTGGAGVAAGALTCSSVTSGFQLLQQTGPGLLLNSKAITSGVQLGILGSTVSSILNSTTAATTIGTALGMAQADTFCPCDLFIK